MNKKAKPTHTLNFVNDVYQTDLQLIKSAEQLTSGKATLDGKTFDARLNFSQGRYSLSIKRVMDVDRPEHDVTFVPDNQSLSLTSKVSFRKNSTIVEENRVTQFSEGDVESFRAGEVTDSHSFHRRYHLVKNSRLIYDLTGSPTPLKLAVHGNTFVVRQIDQYIVVENETAMTSVYFSDAAYRILVVLGFVSGHFLQDFEYSLSGQQIRDQGAVMSYRTLRKGSSSIYHAVTTNPFGYKHLLGLELAAQLEASRNLMGMDGATVSRLTELLIDNEQLLYALVLFNDTNGNDTSLLIRNNCFFVVIEVLLNYIETNFKKSLPRDYANRKNFEKFELAFSKIIAVSPADMDLYTFRNKFFHGAVESISPAKAFEVMLRQISFIHKVVLTYAGFDKFIIDHHALRNGDPVSAFVKVRPKVV